MRLLILALSVALITRLAEAAQTQVHTQQRRLGPRYNELGLTVNGTFSSTPDALRSRYKSFDPDEWGMAGIGGAARYRPIPWFALEAGVIASSTFYTFASRRRREVSGSAIGIIFLNPRDRVHGYVSLGLIGTSASITSAYGAAHRQGQYVGAASAVGVEFRLDRHWAIHYGVGLIIRTRVDGPAKAAPEFHNPETGETSNGSMIESLNAGMTFYF